jgi:hypothetical protein
MVDGRCKNLGVVKDSNLRVHDRAPEQNLENPDREKSEQQ